jgi:hypothetical protein
VAGNLITPKCMTEILGTVFKAVRREPPKKRTPSIALPNPSVMKKLMPLRDEASACA